MLDVSPFARVVQEPRRQPRESPPRPRAVRASRSACVVPARTSTALAGDRRRAGASEHTEPHRARRAAPSTCEAGAALSAPSAQRTTLAGLWQVYLTACSPPECEGENLSWAALDNAAKAQYGQFDPRYLRLALSGNNFGVNH